MKRVTFLVNEDLYKKAKIKTVQTDVSMTNYIIGLIKKDLLEDEIKKRTNTLALVGACLF